MAQKTHSMRSLPSPVDKDKPAGKEPGGPHRRGAMAMPDEIRPVFSVLTARKFSRQEEKRWVEASRLD
jgi:hypothetical protein